MAQNGEEASVSDVTAPAPEEISLFFTIPLNYIDNRCIINIDVHIKRRWYDK